MSLDAVEEMTLGYPEPVTKSHLSRIENGQAVPTFPRMFALSQIYGVPISSLAEKFELDLHRRMVSPDLDGKSPDQVIGELRQLTMSGDYHAALALSAACLDRLDTAAIQEFDAGKIVDLRLIQIDCLTHLERYELAKAQCEALLSQDGITSYQRSLALLSFVISSYRLRRFTIAQMGLDQARAELVKCDDNAWLKATFESTRGTVLAALEQMEQAADAFRAAADLYREAGNPFEACKCDVNLAAIYIKEEDLVRATGVVRTALKVAEESGYDKLKALALSHLAVISYHRGEFAAAETHALRSNSIARPREYLSLVFRNCYYLREIAVYRSDDTATKANERTMKTYLSRVDEDLPELVAFRDRLPGGHR